MQLPISEVKHSSEDHLFGEIFGEKFLEVILGVGFGENGGAQNGGRAFGALLGGAHQQIVQFTDAHFHSLFLSGQE